MSAAPLTLERIRTHPTAPRSVPGVRAAIEGVQAHLFAGQFPEGYWEEPLDCDTTTDCDYIIFLHVLGRRCPEVVAGICRRLLAKQLPDGGWNIYPGGKSEVNATLKGYLGLKIAGHDPAAPYMQAARGRFLSLGGMSGTNSFARIYLAILGMIDWDLAPAVPPEMIFLPKTAPFHIYAMSSWSRAIVVPLSIMSSKRWTTPSAKIPIDELMVGEPVAAVKIPADRGPFALENLFALTDRAMKVAARLPIPTDWNFLRKRAIDQAHAWMLERFEDSGGLAAIFPSMVNSCFALACLGYGLDHPVMKKQCDEVDKLVVKQDDWYRVIPCTSPVWNTCLATLALGMSGVPADDPRLRRAGKWMLSKEVKKPGDWRAGTGGIAPGGWYFEYFNEFYPDVDDTIMVLMALEQVDLPHKAGARRRALNWIYAMQCRDGGWASFDVNNDRQWLTRLPFADHNAMIDPATADITARVLEMLGRLGEIEKRPGALKRAKAFVKRDQRADGSWFGRWGVNYIYGTWQVLEGFAAAGENMNEPWLVRGANWFEARQNPDGGWGESITSYEEPQGFKPADSTPAQTAWALMGLIAAGRAEGDAVRRGVEHLVRTQAADGAWDEHLYTGTGFPKVFYLAYPMYRKYFPLMALGKYEKAIR